LTAQAQKRRFFGSFATIGFGLLFIFQNCGDSLPPMGRALQLNSGESPVAVEGEDCGPGATFVGDELEIVENTCEVETEELEEEPGFEDIQEGRGLAGSPTTPRHLRPLLVANDWSELLWSPSEDSDGSVDSYVLYRNERRLRRIYRYYRSGDYREAEKYWKTSTYLDCNHTRYTICSRQQPEPGETYTYHLTAVDNEGKESNFSNAVEITYPALSSARLDRVALSQEYSLVFEDDFDSAPLDASKWVMRRPWDDPDGTQSLQKLINGEKQYLVDSQLNPIGFDPVQFYSEGATQGVNLVAIQTPPDLLNAAENQPYLSGLITTRRGFNFKYGFVEARLKPAALSGTISTFFLLNTRYDLGVAGQYGEPEIDILEFLGREPRAAFQTYHHSSLTDDLERITHSSPSQVHIATSGEFTENYHTYAVLWEEESVTWYIDDVEVRKLTGSEVSDENMYIVFSLILGSPWAQEPPAAGPFPASYAIDYVRVYQKP